MSRTAIASNAARHVQPPELRLQRIDRFVFPAGDRKSADFVLERLYVAHSLRDRLAWARHRASGGRVLLQDVRAGDLTAASRAAIAAAAAGAWSWLPRTATRWILDTDYPGSSRNRSIVFLFGDDGREPVLVVKRAPVSSVAGSRSLAREKDTLEVLERTLPEDIVVTLPCVVGHDVAEGWETLALTWLPGRSAYAEMHTRLIPSASVAGHFRSAASWLARFHDATSLPGFSVDPATSENGRPGTAETAPVPGWLARLSDDCARTPVRAVRSHGDFWPRNVLLSGRGLARVTGVVDWEQSCHAVSPFEDLFQFALTYGLGYPWSRYRRAEPVEALRRTFLDENRVSNAVRSYLRTYCGERGLDAGLLAAWFRVFLRDRASHDGSKGVPWMDFERMIGGSGRSVFSG